ncbi:hypothetical protein DJ68_19410, partial [Halorubrum sp. C3]
AEEPNVVKLLFYIVKQSVSLAQKYCAASPTTVNDLSDNGFAKWKHVSLRLLRVYMDVTY